MSKFLHTSVRLYSDLGRAYRSFTKTEQLSRWLAKDAAVTSTDTLTLREVCTESVSWVWEITESERERILKANCTDCLHSDGAITYQLEIRFMKCTSLTEYCTEIHVLQYGFSDDEAGEEARAGYYTLWTEKLEALRRLINGNWIIQDRDLTLDVFL